MNSQMYIPLLVILHHERLKSREESEESLILAASSSSKLGLNEQQTMVRPLLKVKRNVVILRDLPADTTEAELSDFLHEAPCGDRLESVKAEVNNTWFAKFKLEDTQEIVLWLRSQSFKGQPVSASIKSEHFLRSFFPQHAAAPAAMGYNIDGIEPQLPHSRLAADASKDDGYIGSWAAESAEMPLPSSFQGKRWWLSTSAAAHGTPFPSSSSNRWPDNWKADGEVWAADNDKRKGKGTGKDKGHHKGEEKGCGKGNSKGKGKESEKQEGVRGTPEGRKEKLDGKAAGPSAWWNDSWEESWSSNKTPWKADRWSSNANAGWKEAPAESWKAAASKSARTNEAKPTGSASKQKGHSRWKVKETQS